MKSLETLIKLHNANLDEKKKQLAQLNKQKDQLAEAIEDLKQELLHQQQVAAENSEVLFAYSAYADHNMKQQNAMVIEIAKLNFQIERVSEELLDIFAEIKKYEIALEQRATEIKLEQNRKEEAFLGETAINIYLSKDSE